MPGKARAASTVSDAGTRTALMVCSRIDSTPVEATLSGATGAAPETDSS